MIHNIINISLTLGHFSKDRSTTLTTIIKYASFEEEVSIFMIHLYVCVVEQIA